MSCTDVETIQAGNGTKTQFSFDFPYIFKSEIHVYFWNVTTKEYDEVLTTDATYPWQITDANPTIVEFTGTAPPAPTAPADPNELTVDNVKIRRITQIDAIRALFNPGSAIRSDDLNKNFEQLRYAIQESNCQGIPEGLYNFLKDYYWDNFDETVYSTDTWDSSDAKIASTSAIDSETETKFDTLVQTTTPTNSSYRLGKTWLQNDDELTLSIWNGSAWTGVVSGGTFTNQPKVVYVDASSGDDNNDGHRISRPKLTIKAAVQQINNDATFGDGSVVVVAPGTYQEACPIDIQKSNVSIVGTALRSCIIHPTVATENSVMFRVNSGSFLQNLTFTGMKAGSGTGNSLDAALPTVQGWNVAFYPGCTITKSPYIQNCTNFSDSEIDNNNINVISPGGGAAGDTDNAPTGGGLLIDGSVPAVTSPLRSIVCDSYTHVGLNGPGILVTNNGYVQCTSSYAFFNKYHIKCLNGGQANLAASTTDFGERALVADGKSPNAIFTSNVDGAANNGDISFNVNQPVTGTGWFGDTNRPASNMLVTVNGVTYPILSAVANTDSEGGNGWTVTISRPDPNNRSVNLGLNGAVADNLAVEFFLRSQIASSGHTMEYVGSGMDYRALPENGGVPDETKQITELNNGKIWTAITDHNGKFKVGGNQTDDPFFEVDQQRGFVTIPEGSIAFNLLSDLTPQLGGDLDVNGNSIILDTGTAADPSLTFTGDLNTGIYSPGADQVAVATNGTGRLFVDASGNVLLNDSASVTSNVSAYLRIRQANAAADTSIGIINAQNSDANATVKIKAGQATRNGGEIVFGRENGADWANVNAADGYIAFSPVINNTNTERVRIDSSGRLLVGTSTTGTTLTNSIELAGGTGLAQPAYQVYAYPGSANSSTGYFQFNRSASATLGAHTLVGSGDRLGMLRWSGSDGTQFVRGAEIYAEVDGTAGVSDMPTRLLFATSADGASVPTERMRIDSSGNVGIGESSPDQRLHISQAASGTTMGVIIHNTASDSGSDARLTFATNSGGAEKTRGYIQATGDTANDGNLVFATRQSGSTSEAMRIDSSGNVGIGTTSPDRPLHVNSGVIDTVAKFESADVASIINFVDSGDASGVSLGVNNGNMIFRSGLTIERMRIDTSGRLLVGTSSWSGNSSKLITIGNTGNAAGTGLITVGKGTAVGSLVADQELGRVVFTANNGEEFARVTGVVDGTPGSADYPGRLVFSTTADGSSTPTERMRIDNGGGVLIGTTIRTVTSFSGVTFTPSTNGRVLIDVGTTITNSAQLQRFYNGNGQVGSIATSASTTNYNTSSDYRLKENVTAVSDGITRLQQLKPSCFNFITDPDKTVDGFLAHEVQDIVPEAVTGEKDAVDDEGNPEYQGIDQSKLVPLLTAALQEAIERIEILEQRLTDAGL